jgi:dTDP-4-amino-4,6-dideoxygalactose transaminase
VNIVSTGFNYRMNKVQLAVGLTQLAKVPQIRSRRQTCMTKMDELLAAMHGIIRPSGHGPNHGSHLYAVRLDTGKVPFSTADLRNHLKETYQIGTVVHYPVVWSWDAFKEIEHDKAGCPEAEKACNQIFSLPIFPDTSDDDLEYIAWSIQQSLSTLT